MKYLSTAIALVIAAPAIAFDNHGMQGHQMQGEGHASMMCCEGTVEEREACRERHRAMGHEMADCEGDHAESHGHHGMHQSDDAHEGHEARSDSPTPDE